MKLKRHLRLLRSLLPHCQRVLLLGSLSLPLINIQECISYPRTGFDVLVTEDEMAAARELEVLASRQGLDILAVAPEQQWASLGLAACLSTKLEAVLTAALQGAQVVSSLWPPVGCCRHLSVALCHYVAWPMLAAKSIQGSDLCCIETFIWTCTAAKLRQALMRWQYCHHNRAAHAR